MKKQGMNVHTLTQLALLVALELVMANTPLGMIPIGPINASLLTIPVAIGAMLLGPAAGALMGKLLARGFVPGTASGNVLRLAPPLVISYEEMDAFVAALKEELA